jgi:hypothetical protein
MAGTHVPTLWQQGSEISATDAADHNTSVTENSVITFLTSILECSAIYISEFFPQYIFELIFVKF